MVRLPRAIATRARRERAAPLSRRAVLLGAAALACRAGARPVPSLVHRPASSLPTTTLPWLALRDHFVATVGPHAGEGRARGALLVLADATFAPRSRFPLHPHEEMEILSVVIDGTLSHHGSEAHGAAVGPRGAQLISARTGIVHAEGNDTDRPTRMLQLWFQPDHRGGTPAYFARQLAGVGQELVAGDAGMPLRTDAQVWWMTLPPGAAAPLVVAPDRQAYLLALTGPVDVRADGAAAQLATGDGAELGHGAFTLAATAGGAALWIDLPA